MRSPRSTSLRSIVASLTAALAVTAVVACAQGVEGGGDDDGEPRVDARRVDARPADARVVDAPGPPVDARPIDAGLPGIDAGPIGGMCTATNQCATGECCWMAINACMERPDPPFDVIICFP